MMMYMLYAYGNTCALCVIVMLWKYYENDCEDDDHADAVDMSVRH